MGCRKEVFFVTVSNSVSINYIVSQDVKVKKQKKDKKEEKEIKYITPVVETQKGKYIDFKI